MKHGFSEPSACTWQSPEPVEVLFFLPQLGGGGAEMNAVRLASGLLEAGVRPHYAVARGPGSYAEHLPDGAKATVLDTGRVQSSTLRLGRAVGPLARLIDIRRPDVLCPVMPLPAFAALAALRRSRHRPAVAVSIQNALYGQSTGAGRLFALLQAALMRRSLPHADRVIALSDGVGRELADLLPGMRDQIEVIHNVGLPLESQLTPEARLPKAPREGGPRLLSCGRLIEQKGYPYLLRAFASFAHLEDARLDILGEGPLRQKLEAMARRLGVADRVSFLGFQADPLKHMKHADVFVLSSLWEGFANVIVEAMSMGVPVVATDCPHGPGEIITDGETGLLVPTADADALAAALQRLIRDRDLRARMGRSGQRRAQDFSSAKIGKSYARVFRELATGSARVELPPEHEHAAP